MSTRNVTAPPPPAGPGESPEVGAINRYVSEIARWRLHRAHELQAIDEVTRTHDDRDSLTAEITAAMTLFHAIAQRHDLLLATWDDGNDPTVKGNGDQAREWVSQLVWGVLELPDGDAQALAMPLPDGLRLSDSMVASLRTRIGMDQGDVSLKERLRSLEAEVERVRGALEEGAGSEEGLDERLDVVSDQLAALGERDDNTVLSELGDVGLEVAAVDRAIVVGRVSQAHERADREQAMAEYEHLVARGQAVRSLAEQALTRINPAPRLGVPDVTALGEVPEGDDDLATYVGNLERIGRALDQAHSVYAAALAAYADLADRAERLARTLAGCGAPTSVDLAGMLTAAKECLHNEPADIRRAAALVAAQEAYLAELRTEA
ncbi:MAG: hypothetical protein GX344_10525 [Intrasporangiaceae bacterium]|nr:hypothetical protein [Intrasporangiaceae bacterium]